MKTPLSYRAAPPLLVAAGYVDHLWASAAVGVLHSTVWEYGVEGWNETPSVSDLVFTPISGLALGELRYGLYHASKNRWYLRALFDPVAELEMLIMGMGRSSGHVNLASAPTEQAPSAELSASPTP